MATDWSAPSWVPQQLRAPLTAAGQYWQRAQQPMQGWPGRLQRIPGIGQPLTTAARVGLTSLQQAGYAGQQFTGFPALLAGREAERRNLPEFFRWSGPQARDELEAATTEQLWEASRTTGSWIWRDPARLERTLQRLEAGEETEKVLREEQTGFQALYETLVDPTMWFGLGIEKARRLRVAKEVIEPTTLQTAQKLGMELPSEGLSLWQRMIGPTKQSRMFQLAETNSHVATSNLQKTFGRTVDDMIGMVDNFINGRWGRVPGPTVGEQKLTMTLKKAGIKTVDDIPTIADYHRKVARAQKLAAAGNFDEAQELLQEFAQMQPAQFSSGIASDIEAITESWAKSPDGFNIPAATAGEKILRGMKTVMSIAYLNFNPGYVVRNFGSQSVLSVVRGLNPFARPSEVEGYALRHWPTGMPSGVGEAFGPAGEVSKLPAVLEPASRATRWLERLQGMALWRHGHNDAWTATWRPGRVGGVIPELSDELLEQARAVHPRLPEMMETAIARARNPQEVLRNLRALLTGKASIDAFVDIDDILRVEPEGVEAIARAVSESGAKGGAELIDALQEPLNVVGDHVSEVRRLEVGAEGGDYLEDVMARLLDAGDRGSFEKYKELRLLKIRELQERSIALQQDIDNIMARYPSVSDQAKEWTRIRNLVKERWDGQFHPWKRGYLDDTWASYESMQKGGPQAKSLWQRAFSEVDSRADEAWDYEFDLYRKFRDNLTPPEVLPVPPTPRPPVPIAAEVVAPQVEGVTEGLPRGVGSVVEGWQTPTRRYQFQYRVMELDDLVASHTKGFAPNPQYPAQLQPRARERAVSQVDVSRIVQQLDPEELINTTNRLDSGPPIIGADGIVESGNARIMALRKAGIENPNAYQRYTDDLISKAPEFGLSPDEISRMNRPTLVRERISEVDRLAFVEEANSPVAAAMSIVENGRMDARRLSPEAVANLYINPNYSIEQILNHPENRGFVRSFIAQIPEVQRGQLVETSGRLSQPGVQRVLQALFAQAYGEDSGLRVAQMFFETIDPDIKNVGNALAQAAPKVARAESLIKQGLRPQNLSIGDEAANAAVALGQLRRQGMTAKDYLAQTSMFRRSPLHLKLVGMYDENIRSAKKMGSILGEYADSVTGLPDPRAITMPGMPGPTIPTDAVKLLERAIDKITPARRFGPGAAALGELPTALDVATDHQGAVSRLVNKIVRRSAQEPVSAPPEFVEAVLKHARDDVIPMMEDVNLAATRIGLAMRETVMLRYPHRKGFDYPLAWLAPYHFWYGRTAWNTAMLTLDRPGLAIAYYRIWKALQDAQDEPGFPTRLKGRLRIPVPNMPSWMGGDVYFDPLKTLTPIPSFVEPYLPEEEETTRLGRAVRAVGAFLSPNPFFTTPLAAAGLLGPKEQWVTGAQIAPLRYLKGITGLLGRPTGYPGGVDVTPVRGAMGLPPGETWDPYRTERMLANMAGTKEISSFDARLAMLLKEGDAYEEAQRRAGQERGLTLTGQAIGVSGLAVYPPGERIQRGLKEEQRGMLDAVKPGFGSMTYEEREALRTGDPKLDEAAAKVYKEFYQKYPEYEARAALWKDDRALAIDLIWDAYWEAGGGKKARELLGEDFSPRFKEYFISRDTRDYDQFTDEELKLMARRLAGKVAPAAVEGAEVAEAGAAKVQLPTPPAEGRAIAGIPAPQWQREWRVMAPRARGGALAPDAPPASQWEQYLEGIEDVQLRQLIAGYFAQAPSQRGVYARRYQRLRDWLASISAEELERISAMFEAWSGHRETARVPRAPTIRYYQRW